MAKKGLAKVEKIKTHNWGKTEIEMEEIRIIPDKEKLQEEAKKLKEILDKAEERNVTNSTLGGEDR